MRKTLIFLLVAVVLGASSAFAREPVSFTWLQPTKADGTEIHDWGTIIFSGKSSGTYIHSNNAGVDTTEYTMTIECGTGEWFFAAKHIDPNNYTSDFSNEVSWIVPECPAPFPYDPMPGGDLTEYEDVRKFKMQFRFK